MSFFRFDALEVSKFLSDWILYIWFLRWEKSNLISRGVDCFDLMFTNILIENEWKQILKFYSDKIWTPVLALIRNYPELCNSFNSRPLGFLLKAINCLSVSQNSDPTRCIGLKFLPNVFLTRVTHPWKFQSIVFWESST